MSEDHDHVDADRIDVGRPEADQAQADQAEVDQAEADQADIRAALHSLADGPAPPVTTDVATLVSRGRRRVLLQRTTAAVGVMAVVSVVAVGANLLAHGGAPSAAPITTLRQPTSVSAPADPGWTVLSLAPTTRHEYDPSGLPDPDGTGTLTFCVYPQVPAQAPGTAAVPDEKPVVASLTSALADIVPADSVRLVTVSWSGDQPAGGAVVQVVAHVTEKGRTGQVSLQVQAYSGSALANADFVAGANTVCAPPQRRILPGGTLLQLGPVYRPAVGLCDEQAWAYTRAGYGYTLTVEGGDGSGNPAPSDLTDHWMPLTPTQVGALVQQVAAVG
jgi:hypothetical protein